MVDKDSYYRLLGVKLLEQLDLYKGNEILIDVIELGKAIYNFDKVIITVEERENKNVWILKNATEQYIREAWGHGFIVKGFQWERIGNIPSNETPYEWGDLESEKEYYINIGNCLLEKIKPFTGLKMRINTEKLGKAINKLEKMVITVETIKGERMWVLRLGTDAEIKKAWGHGYLING